MQTKLSKLLISFLVVGLSAFALGCPSDEDPENDEDEYVPAISVDDQELDADEADEVAITEATIDADGFAVVTDEDDEVLGATDLIGEGDHSDLDVTLDRDAEDGETFTATLHYDETEAGEFEDADDQPPVTGEDGDVVEDTFEITIDDDEEEITPSISVSDQTLAEDAADEVNIDEATLDDDGLVAVYEDDEGDFGDELGTADIDEGDNTDVTVGLDRDATDGETLWGVLYYEEDDQVTDEDEEAVADDFEITIDDDAEEDENSVSASDQTLNVADGDLSTIVVVDEAEIIDDGWVVITDDACDGNGNVIGHTFLDAGTSEDVDVELFEPAADRDDNRDLCARLHDDDGDETFDGGDDQPLEDDDGDYFEETFTVTVTEGTPAIRVTLSSDTDNTYYIADDVEPAFFDDHVDTDENDEDLEFTFNEDWRYEFDNTETGTHPFEFINDEGEVLLAQDSEGELEEDEESIDWVEDGDIFRFTVSDEFRDDTDLLGNVLSGDESVSAYQCGEHPGMTGPVDYN